MSIKEGQEGKLDEIPEGGLADIMKVLGPTLKTYDRIQLYKLFKLIPVHLRYAFWTWAGELLWRLPQTRKIIKNGIKSLHEIFPNKKHKEILTISKNSWRALGYGFGSMLLVDVPNWTAQNIDKHVEFQGLEHVRAALERGKGVIIASTHVGLLPAMYLSMALKGFKVNLIANVRVSGPLVAIHPVPNLRCIPTGSMEGPHSIKPLLHRVLRENQLLFIYADFSQRKQMGIRFLGRLGHTPAGIPVLAEDTGAAIIPAFTFAHTLNKMIVKFMPEFHLIHRPDMTRKEFLGENMLELNNLMTWLIRKAPVLYFEHTSYDMLKLYKREVEVTEADSREVGQKLLDLAEQVINTTYERGRNDQRYLDNISNLREQLLAIPAESISPTLFTDHFEVGWLHVRDSFIDMCQKALKMGLDKGVVKIIHTALKDLIVSPL